MERNPQVDYHGERRSNETHQSTTDPEARLARKGNSVAAKLSYVGHPLMENRSALIADMDLSLATGYAERETALRLLGRLPKSARRRTVAGDKGYDSRQRLRRRAPKLQSYRAATITFASLSSSLSQPLTMRWVHSASCIASIVRAMRTPFPAASMSTAVATMYGSTPGMKSARWL